MKQESSELSLPPEIDTALAQVGLFRLGDRLPGDTNQKKEERARAFYNREPSGFSQLSLVRGTDEVLRWQEGAVTVRHSRRAGRASLPMGKIEKQYIFKKLHDPNQVAAAVEQLDNVLTDPNKRDLYRLTGNDSFDEEVQRDIQGQFSGKKLLLFVHGTFSHCDGVCAQIREAKAGQDSFGRKFLSDARAHYDDVLAFNHPTLAVSPIVNAFRLAALLRDANGPPASVDVICHSRGGLVTRWWLEGFAAPETTYRAVFVASPLGGTSLAAPARIKSGMDFLSNVASAIGTGAGLTGVPMIQIAGGVLSIISSVTKFAAKTPAIDAAVATIPGLMGQSRVGNNFEINNLRAAGGWQSRQHEYYAIRSNFVPPPADKWKFWRVFCSPNDLMLGWANKALDELIFTQRATEDAPLEAAPNDLVVDCNSMQELADSVNGKITQVYDFGDSDKVHHTNYLEQKPSLDFIRASFGIGES